MKIKLFLFLLIFIFISCNKVENTSESVNSSPLIKKSIIVGDAKYDGPEKISYYHAAIRNGNIDINNLQGLENIGVDIVVLSIINL